MISDRPRRILKKEVAAAVGIHAGTLSVMLADGLKLPCWPCTVTECVAAVREWRERHMKFDEEKRRKMKSDEV